ncbi:MAG: PqqD family protein [Clostridiales bacterium]|nr:PqqD family protein [Clostridiales bacterium]
MIYQKNPSVIVNNVDDTYIMIETNKGTIINVNEIVNIIWESDSQMLDSDKIVASLLDLYDVDLCELEKDISEVLTMLYENGFILELEQ